MEAPKSTFSTSQYGVIPILIAILLIFVLLYWKNIYIILKTLRRDIRLVPVGLKLIVAAMKIKRRDDTIVSLFERQVQKHPKKIVFYFQDKHWTYEDIDKFSNKVASVFLKQGYKKGDVVGLLSYNCLEYIGLWLGLAKIGVVAALINTNLRMQPLAHCVNVAKCKGFIYTSDFAKDVEEIRNDLPSDLDYFEYGEGTDFSSSLSGASDGPVQPEQKVTQQDKFLYIYTSGTTGLPKAAIIGHNKSALFSAGCVYLLNIKEDDIIYDPLPLYHGAGGLISIAPALGFGVAVVIKTKFSARAYFPDCVKYKCTIGQYIGELCRYVLATPPSPSDTQHSVRVMLGNGLRPDIWKPFVERFKVPQMFEIYGSTEGNANIGNLDNTIGAVGFLPTFVPLSWIPVAIIRYNTETNEPIRGNDGLCIRCKPGEPGMWIGLINETSPTQRFDGYVDKKETRKKIIRDVFKKGDAAFISGDILVMDEYRYLYFKDRTGDTYRWKGENVSTGEVESVISKAINYRDCTAYGVQIGELEGRAGMIAVADPQGDVDLQALNQHIDKQLPSYARPLFLRILQELEVTGTFKIKKTSLQKEGFDPKIVKDKLYFRDPTKGFVPLTKEIYEDIVSERVKL